MIAENLSVKADSVENYTREKKKIATSEGYQKGNKSNVGWGNDNFEEYKMAKRAITGVGRTLVKYSSSFIQHCGSSQQKTDTKTIVDPFRWVLAPPKVARITTVYLGY